MIYLMNITKYCEFLLENKHSDKKNKDYYCISIKFKDFIFPIVFLTESKYHKMLEELK